MEAPTFFSLVVPTLGRSDEVARLLDSIERFAPDETEVIVVDQNRDDRLHRLVERRGARFPVQHHQVDFKGAARARNYGARLARGRYLNFPDDDCELLSDTLATAREILDRLDPKVLIGMTVDGGEVSTTAFVRDERHLTLWSMWGRNIEATMFFERDTFFAVGGYDERFGVGSVYGSGEGAEILIRLLRTLPRNAVYFTHRIRFQHPNKSRDFSEAGARRELSYARGHGALFAKWCLPFMVPEMGRYAAASAIGALVYGGDKARMYRARLRGFVEGFREFRRESRAAGQASERRA